MRTLLLTWLLAIVPMSQAASVSVTDFAGREVTLPKPATRLIALAPHIVENTYSAGAGDLLVGAVSYADYPPEARKLPRVGSYQSWSLEGILQLKPDLVLLWASGNGLDRARSLERLGIPVYISEPRRLEDIPQTLRDIGQLTGRSTTAEPAAAELEQALAQLAERNRDKTSLSVLYQVWNQPLQTLNGSHLISDVISLCGARNVFADAASLAPKISVEAVIARNPDAIVASGMDEARPEWLDEWLAYPQLRAVANNALFFVPPDYIQRPTARVLLGATSLCRQLDSARH